MKAATIAMLFALASCSSTPSHEPENQFVNEDFNDNIIEDFAGNDSDSLDSFSEENWNTEDFSFEGNASYDDLFEETQDFPESMANNVPNVEDYGYENLVETGSFQESPEQETTLPQPVAPPVAQTQQNGPTQLWWIGYDFDIRSRMLHVHLVCKGEPELGFALTRNERGLHELTIQLADTRISRRIRRKVNASEFPAPVSFVRSEAHGLDAHVILTLREALEPEVLQSTGHVRLSFPLGAKYLAMAKARKTPVRNIEVLFAEASPVMDEPIEAKMDNKEIFRPDTMLQRMDNMAAKLDLGDLFGSQNTENNEESTLYEPVREVPLQYDPQGSVVFTSSVLGVAQDDFNYDSWWGEEEVNELNMLTEPVAQTETITGQEDAYRIENYNGKPIQLEFHQAPLSQVLRAISSQIGSNFVYPTDVGEIRVSVRLSGVAWDAALSAILQTNRLGMAEVSHNVVRVDRIDRMSEYLGLKQRSDEATRLTVPPKVLVSRLSYTRAEDMARIIETFVRSTVAPDSMRVSFSARSNTLIVEAPPSVLSRTKAIIEKVDVPTPQVEIASRLVEVFNSAANFLGISWGGMHNFDANRATGSGALAFPNSMNSAFSIDPGVSGDARAGSVAINLGSINDFLNIDLRLRMEELKGRTEILQSSRIIVADRERGSITSGKSLYLQRSSQGGVVIASGEAAAGQASASGIDEINFDLSLEVTPEVTNNGYIILELNLQSSNADDSSGAAVAASSNRSLNTRLKKKDGQTAVIGGIYDTSKRESTIGVPFLSSLPLIGPLFRSKSYNESQTEMMIFITPKILNPEAINTEFSYEDLGSATVQEAVGVQNSNQWNNSDQFENYNNNFNNSNFNFEDNYNANF
jgi:type IV pilus secretin PilQ/predicted competence protein